MEPDDLLCSRNARSQTPSPGLVARPGRSIAKQSEGRAGEKYLPVDGRVRKRTQWKINQPSSLKIL